MRTCYIDSELVSIAPGWNITDKLNARTTLSLTVVDLLDLDKIDNGDSIELYDDLDLIFSGIVLSLQKYEPGPGILEYGITVVDNSALADKRRIAKVYENEYAGDIARDLITEKLGDEGVTEGDIQNGPVIKKAVFDYITCAEALNYLKKITGYVWNINKTKQLNFFDRSTNNAPFALTDAIQHSNFKQNSTVDQYRNTQYIRGGKGKTATQTNEIPTPGPDGVSRKFVLRFPLAEKPIIEVNLNGAGWTAIGLGDIGVNGIDNNKKWYFSFDSQIITQDSSETVLTNVDAVRVTYTGLRNIFLKIDDPAGVTARAAAETGTSGIYESLEIEKSINDVNQGIQYAQGLIETYGQIKDDVIFDTYVSGLEAGQLLPVQKTLFDINEDYLIESVTIRPDGDSLLYYIKALDGAAVGAWEEFFKELIAGKKDFVIAENEVIILLQNQTETEGYQGSIEVDLYNALYPANNLYPSNNLYPNRTATEVTLND